MPLFLAAISGDEVPFLGLVNDDAVTPRSKEPGVDDPSTKQTDTTSPSQPIVGRGTAGHRLPMTVAVVGDQCVLGQSKAPVI